MIPRRNADGSTDVQDGFAVQTPSFQSEPDTTASDRIEDIQSDNNSPGNDLISTGTFPSYDNVPSDLGLQSTNSDTTTDGMPRLRLLMILAGVALLAFVSS